MSRRRCSRPADAIRFKLRGQVAKVATWSREFFLPSEIRNSFSPNGLSIPRSPRSPTFGARFLFFAYLSSPSVYCTYVHLVACGPYRRPDGGLCHGAVGPRIMLRCSAGRRGVAVAEVLGRREVVTVGGRT